MSNPPAPPPPPSTSTPAPPDDAFADIPSFATGSPSRSTASGGSTDDGLDGEIEFVEKPMPCGIRNAYVAGVRKQPGKDGKPPSIVIDIQVSDPEFPPKKGVNDPISLWIATDEPAKAKRVLKALGVDSGLTDGSVWRSIVNKPCRVFVTVYNDRVTIPRFAPNPKKRSDSDKQFWAHVDSLGLGDSDAIAKLFNLNYCGLLPAE